MAEIKWIKLSTNMFDDEKIRLISSMAGGNDIILIWIRLLVLAGKCNASGYILLSDTIPYTDTMLATLFGESETMIRQALDTLQQFRMIDLDEHGIYIENWEKHQNVEGMEKVREQARKRNIIYREKQKQLRDVSVTSHDGTDIELEVDIKNKEVNNSCPVEPDDIPYQGIINYLNQRTQSAYKASSDKTRKLIHARWKEGYGFTSFQTVIDKKAKEWLGTEQAKYLRPETLFGTKFEGYLNQKEGSPSAIHRKDTIESLYGDKDLGF